jgi:hypothetical protein
MTMRPQLGSSPASAVLTSGELAMASAMRLRGGVGLGPGHRDSREFGGALAVLHHLMRESRITPRAPRRKARAGVVGAVDGRPAAAPVAASSSVSEVEVSLSTVMALKLVSVASASIACSSGCATARR